MVNPNINSFAQTTVQGQIDLQFPGSVVSAYVSPNQSGSIVAGQAVAFDTAVTAGPGTSPAVISLAGNTTAAFGIALRNLKDQNYPANNRLEVALAGSVVYMTTDTGNFTFNRGAALEFDTSNNTVQSWQGINPIIGYAYDSSSAAGSLIRMRVESPVFSNQSNSHTLTVTATLAQINAGLVLISGAPSKKITVTNYIARVTGAFSTGTSVELESTNASPVAVTTIAEAGLTNGAVLLPSSSNTTLGAGFGAAMGSGDGLQVINNGTASTGGTSITFTIQYTQA